MALPTFSLFTVREISSFKGVNRNGAGVPGLGRVFLQEVLQILPIMQVFFVVIQRINIGSAPKVVKLSQGIF